MDDDLENLNSPAVWLAVLGGIVGACIPLVVGLQSLHELQQPRPPGVGGCGLQVFGAVFFTAFGPPFAAIALGMVGCFFGYCLELWQRRRWDEFDEWDE